ncbi:prolyl oligopeptidase family serine peptidase [Bosea sp. F3-2]|uniref:alpha/beta hydrolase n=1 Tax=Bosea sp. F3-2 TaxID=2599640 RepID=UPI0011F058E3|nr:alpha/beta hydrolase [Bosea sp. F3-2]QEL26251.1 prolyl oligopeptidase family serine peptidase [Bosea sp. F3-2]
MNAGIRVPFPSRASRRGCLALALLVAPSRLGIARPHQSGEERSESSQIDSKYPHLNPDSTIGDLLRHPAFTGFAGRVLPWDDRAYNERTPLDAIGSLLPYHNHVDAASTVAALNRMIDDAGQGRTIFFDIYSDADKREQPKAQTGLFFFRGRPGAPFAVICPGGGFAYVGSVHEGFPYAAKISEAGFNAFMLKYRAGLGGAVATQDFAAAISFVSQNADRLGVGTASYSLWGSSAGARMAASIGSHGTAKFGHPELAKPSAVVIAYTAHSDLAADEPPTFVVIGEQDGISPPSAMQRRVSALRRAGTEVAYREYPGVGHGFGLGIGTSAEGWIDDAIRFWIRHQPR